MKALGNVMLAALLIAALAPAVQAAEHGDWVELFDGESLDGWTVRNGTAEYEVKDGTIVGTTVEDSPNTFLSTDENYGDFELEFDVKLLDNELNSGVQIRSKEGGMENTPEGRVNGPQVEIEASPGQSGYIYGEGTGMGWLSPKPKEDTEGSANEIFKNDEWNHYRIVADGPNIKTWINGEQVEDLTHEEIYETHPEGFISLQVHSIPKDQGPYSVAWKNIRLRELD